MKRISKEDKVILQFVFALQDMVKLIYCLGGASDDEILAATVDYLQRLSLEYSKRIKTDVYCPYYR